MSVPKQKKPSEIVSDFLSAMREFNSQITYSTEQQKKLEAEIDDMEHQLELTDMSYHEKAKLAVKLQDLLRERRFEKDRCENLTPIVEAWKNGGYLSGLERALGEARKVERRFENRIYKLKAAPGVIEGGKKKTIGKEGD